MIRKKLILLIASLPLSLVLLGTFISPTAYALQCKDGTIAPTNLAPEDQGTFCNSHGGGSGSDVDFVNPDTNPSTDPACASKPANDPCHNIIVNKYINPMINFLSIGFGLVVTIMIVIGGIQYASAGGDPARVANAKKRIYNAILALLVFAFMYAFLQWLVPGGIF